jgi:hypothetical protein
MIKASLTAAGLVMCCASGHVLAHSWYPVECCTAYDCDVVDSVSINKFGLMIVTDGTRRLVIPDDTPRFESRDNRVHLCYNRDEVTEGKPPRIFCIFLPPPG